jgi:hypothetical protein
MAVMHQLRAVVFLLGSLVAISSASASPYDREINAVAARFGVSSHLVHAVVKVESNYNKNALSHAGAKGLMQLMPMTAKRFGVSNRVDPVQSLRGGTQYLAWLLKRYKGDLNLALAGYNAGEGAVDKYKGIPPYKETKQYVVKVLKELKRRQRNKPQSAVNPNMVRVSNSQDGKPKTPEKKHKNSRITKHVVRVTTSQAGTGAAEKKKTPRQIDQTKPAPDEYTVRYAYLTETQTQAKPIAFSFFEVN